MATLKEIRERLHAVHNIRKITSAMEMVAGARLHRAQQKVAQAQPYISAMQRIVQNLATLDLTHPLFEKRTVKKSIVVVVAADRGLCGAYNAHVFSSAERFLEGLPGAVELIAVGRKAVEHYKTRPWPIRHEILKWGGVITYSQVQSLVQELMQGFLSGSYDDVWLVATQYVNLIERRISCECLLPLEAPSSEAVVKRADYLFEPSADVLLAEMLPRYCTAKVQAILHEAYASELAARMLAMKLATKNADEMIDKLTLTRNKVRQAGITKEMLEIIGGAEGLAC
jgi:F-type H+-transporting ATPase subunit gamma